MLGDDLACVRIDTGRYSHIVYSQDTVIFSRVSFMEVYLLLQNPKPRDNVHVHNNNCIEIMFQ